MPNDLTKVALLISVVVTASGLLLAADDAVTVSVDCAQVAKAQTHLWGYVNASRRAPPPKELCGLVEKEFGRPTVTRCWLMLDQMWDYRSDTYRFDYEINKDYYKGDPHPAKKLDFISFHSYWVEKALAAIAQWERQIDAVLQKASLPVDIPIFVTEIGYALKWKMDPKKNLRHAVGMPAYQYEARHARDLRLFPWVQYHSRAQIAMVQLDTRPRMTRYGAAMKMLRMHRRHEVVTHSSGLDKNGNGLGALATMDDKGLTVQLWNLDPGGSKTARVNVSMTNIPKSLRPANPLQRGPTS